LKLNFKFEGVGLLNRKFGKLEDAVSGKATEDDALKQAKVIAEDARSRAPLGPTGNLKRSLLARLLDKKGDNPRAALAGVDRKIAPHARLVEYGGTRPRKSKKGKVLHSKKTGEFFGKVVAPMPAHPFFRPAVDAHKEGISGNIKKRIGRC